MDLYELFGTLPRQGPGNTQASLRALSLMTELPAQLRIADLGCGTGAQTRLLARATGGDIVAVDQHGPYLKQLQQRATAVGVGDQIRTVEGDISQPRLDAGSFDVVWSEGAAYAIGFEKALDAWVPLLREGGYLVVTECCWLTDSPSAECRAFWADGYPDMRGVAANRALIEARDLSVVGSFPLPDEAWWDDFYTPLERRLAELESGGQLAADLLESELREIEMFRAHGHEYGYVFYVARKKPFAPPPGLRSTWLGRLRSRSS